jgi:MFS transporter, DHA3 family, macrolide efflux protein
MKTNSALAKVFSPLVGSGPGAGMGLLFFFCSVGVVLVGLAGYFFRPVREAETILPDHDQLEKAQETSA